LTPVRHLQLVEEHIWLFLFISALAFILLA
jgi:hypothetical protein